MVTIDSVNPYCFLDDNGNIDFDQARKLMLKTMNYSLTDRDYLGNATLGLCGELGEILIVDRFYRDKNDPDSVEFKTKFRLEVGDLCWYLFLFSEFLGMPAKYIFSKPYKIKCNEDYDNLVFDLTRGVLTLADKMKKILYHSPVDSANWRGSLEDDQRYAIIDLLVSIGGLVMWLIKSENISLAGVFQSNIDKLTKRHKGGKFSSELQDAKLDEVEAV